MNQEYHAIVKQDGEWWIGWIEELPGVNCQERTHDELISSLRITLKEALEYNRQDAIDAVGAGYQEEKIAI
jgi:predicted RNase H-like HicB family nuclease